MTQVMVRISSISLIKYLSSFFSVLIAFHVNFLLCSLVDLFQNLKTGWRLDYFLVSESIADKVHDSYILPDVTGSDHCPIGLVVKL